MLVNSIGQRIYINLERKEFNDHMMRTLKTNDYTNYHPEMPDGNWRISGITDPPLRKDIKYRENDGKNCCKDIEFDHNQVCVTQSSYHSGLVFMKGVNLSTADEVMLYSNDSESTIRTKHELNSRMSTNEKFWATKIGDHKKILDIQPKPIETYIDDDILNVLGYLKRRPNTDTSNTEKTFHNEYHKRKRHIYSSQVYLPKEEYLIMQNFDIYTLVKKRPIDELFAILYIAQMTNDLMTQEVNTFIDDHGVNET